MGKKIITISRIAAGERIAYHAFSRTATAICPAKRTPSKAITRDLRFRFEKASIACREFGIPSSRRTMAAMKAGDMPSVRIPRARDESAGTTQRIPPMQEKR